MYPEYDLTKMRNNKVALEARQIFCCKGAEFSRITLQKCWCEIYRLEDEVAKLERALVILEEKCRARPIVRVVPAEAPKIYATEDDLYYEEPLTEEEQDIKDQEEWDTWQSISMW